MGHQATQPHGVDVHAVDHCATGTVELLVGGVGLLPQAGLGPGDGDALGGRDRRAGGSVLLVGVVQLDDLDRLEEPRCLLREGHRQHGREGEVRGDDDAELAPAGAL